MRSALLCVFVALLVHREGSQADDADFKPTPIPLDEWHGVKKDQPVGTLQETIATDATPAVAAVPAHYWEDALRHSVYLTLVRDKIDQLIAKGNVISPDSKVELHVSKEVDDHNLWEKIKAAPFDRLKVEEPAILGDITIMSKGRLLEEKEGFRFTEDEKSKEKCSNDECMEGVKAFWSVKRVRQRDAETVPGKYHYELTFSVNSQTPQKHKKPYDNPVRTFTVREGTPVEQPQYNTQPSVSYAPRPQRAVWFHKNITPTQHYQSRKTYQPQGLDRLFLSLFSSEEDRYDEPPRHRPNPHVQQGFPPHQHSKAGYAGTQAEQHYQKKLAPYPYKPTTYKYTRPPLAPPPSASQAEHHYIDSDKFKIPFSPPIVQHHHIDSEVKTKSPYPPQVQYHYDLKSKVQPPPHFQHQHYNIQAEVTKTKNPYLSQQDFGYEPSNVVKTTKPAVLPTPPLPPLNLTTEVTSNISEITTKEPEIVTAFKPYPKQRPPPTKVSYFPEHVRPPVFNAPPGVFVTMDKKPFKPLPPLKFHHPHPPKPVKNRPVDFRPSPQVLDVQFSDPDPLSDAFRPMAMNYADSNTTDTSEKAGSGKRKNVTKSKPPKKHELIKSHRPTTSVPEIITAQSQSIETEDSLHWANNLLGAFIKTTPMEPQKEINITETTTPFEPTTTVTDPTTTVKLSTTTKKVKKPEAKTTTTPRPTKRTRPPPKFTKPEKIKKHKRVTSTTTTSTTTTTEKPQHKRPLQDLMPQASSAATGTTKPSWQPKSKIRNESLTTESISTETATTTTTSRPSTTTRTFTTTPRPTTTTTKMTTTTTKSTTTPSPSPTPETEPPVPTTQPKSKNRFRQSTLMQKGTSVNHDKWSISSMDKNKTAYSNARYQQRRKGSNFHGYVSSTPKNVDEDHHNEEHVDLAYNSNAIEISSTTEMLLEVIPATPEPTQTTSENQVEEQSDYPHGTEETDHEVEDSEESKEHDDEQESKDRNEFIFTQTESNDDSNEVKEESQEVKEENVVTTLHANIKNKTKCKKKKHLNLTTTEENPSSSVFNDLEINVTENISSTTTEQTTTDIFSQIFGSYAVEGLPNNDSETKVEPLGEGSNNQERFAQIDDDLEDFLDSLEGKKRDNETNYDQYDEEKDDDDNDDDEDEELSPFDNEEEIRSPRHADVNYEDYRDRPYSFLELMAME